MQIIHSKGNTVEKVIRDKEGKLIRARFFVFESNGRIKARLIDFVYLAPQALLTCANFLLTGITKTKQVFESLVSTPTYSFAFVQDNLDYSGSKPRAPTF